MLKAVLFDLDGTLVRYGADYAHFVSLMAAGWGIEEAGDRFFEFYRSAVLAEGPVSLASSVEFALRSTGRSMPDEFSVRCLEAVEGYAGGIELLPGALELLAAYEHLPRAIVSNGPSDMQRAAIRSAGIEGLFETVVISGDVDVAVRKPNPEIFLIACRRLGVLPGEVLMIGDNEEADLAGAAVAGIPGVHVSDALLTL